MRSPPRGSRLDVLDSSWRSRPSIVRYLNAVFGEAFERDGMERALVELSPERLETHDSPAVVRWTLPRTRKVAEQADALALAILEFKRSERRVNDPETRTISTTVATRPRATTKSMPSTLPSRPSPRATTVSCWSWRPVPARPIPLFKSSGGFVVSTDSYTAPVPGTATARHDLR